MYITNECVNQNNKTLLQLTRAAKEKSGWMSKKGKRRWFILKNNHLMWYSEEQVRFPILFLALVNYILFREMVMHP